MRRLNAGQIIDAALDNTNETRGGFIIPSTSLRWINDAQEESVQDLGPLGPQGLTTLKSITAGVQEYPLPTTTTFLLAVWWYDGVDWRRLTYLPYHRQWGKHYDIEGTNPQHYYLRGNTIGLMPVPSTSGSDLIKIDDIFAPLEITSRNDYPFGGHEIFQRFNRELQHYITAMSKARHDAWPLHDKWMAKFEMGKERMKRVMRMRVLDPMAEKMMAGMSAFDLVGDGSMTLISRATIPDYVP